MYFVLELLTVDGGAAAAGTGGIASLEHEIGDYAVEEDIIVVAAAGEFGKIFAGLRDWSEGTLERGVTGALGAWSL